MVAAAVLLCKPPVAGLDDSKKLSAKARARLDGQIRESCAFGIGVVEVADIDRLNILGATMLAMSRAMALLCEAVQSEALECVIDGNLTPHGRCDEWRWPARAIIGGDASEPSIAAASILAKHYRDTLMCDAAREYPHYGWDRNKGYGTREHMQALQKHGPTPLHRQSFAPVAQLALPV